MYLLSGKLALCREERIRIMDEGKGGVLSKRKPTITTSKAKKTDARPRPQARKARLAGKKSLSKSGILS